LLPNIAEAIQGSKQDVWWQKNAFTSAGEGKKHSGKTGSDKNKTLRKFSIFFLKLSFS